MTQAVVIVTIVSGILSGIVASFCYAGIKRLFKPKILIVPKIMYFPDKNTIGIKIISKTRVRITDIKISVDFLDYNDTEGGYTISNLEMTKRFNPILDKYVDDKNQANPPALYALRIGYKVNIDLEKDTNPEDKFLVSVKATHPYSGSKIYISREFYCQSEDIMSNCMFNNGDTCSFHKIVTT